MLCVGINTEEDIDMIKDTYKPFVITIESHGKKFSGECNWDCSSDDVMDIMRGLMIAAGFSEGWLANYCEQYVMENELFNKQEDDN